MKYLLAFIVLVFSEMTVAKTFRILNWVAYIDESVLKDFGDKYNVDVIYDTFDDIDGFRQKFLVKNPEGAYDIIFPPVDYIPALIERNILYKLNNKLLPNIKNLSKTALSDLKKYDSANSYVHPYLWGTVGLGINVQQVKKALNMDEVPQSWDLVFKPEYAEKLASCGISYLDSEIEIFPLALNYLGRHGDSKKRTDIVYASKYLRKLASTITYFDSESYLDRLQEGKVCVAIGYSGDIFQAISQAQEAQQGVELQYIIPEEGTSRWIDAVAIPSNTSNPELAHAFLNYLMEPEVIAKITNYVWYANNIPASTVLLDEAIVSDQAIYPTESVQAQLFSIPKYDLRLQRSMVRYWSRVKCAHSTEQCRAPISGLPGL
ncbi:extracellular solute-binding protein [Spartinivicinus poritis]|uniref:Putrescine-binding periplasmic protein n=1 Tax=Spartinivicinus poritis TaxID=2994640 RepID=A0ABT5U816_9GAMM|nr:extracellular solute-binding protein [Spartinivicinus sp. A2-2]MDE1461294.1 extracellular solute-binding protein [Spartinivicinus sp. A2-2]